MPVLHYIAEDWRPIFSLLPRCVDGKWFWFQKIERRIMGVSSFWDERFESEYRQCGQGDETLNSMKW